MVFGVSEKVFGDAATWQPLAGGDIVEGVMLMREPTKNECIALNLEFGDTYTAAEYSGASFTGLYESLRQNNAEVITVDRQGTQVEYTVQAVTRKYDGYTYVAIMRINE